MRKPHECYLSLSGLSVVCFGNDATGITDNIGRIRMGVRNRHDTNRVVQIREFALCGANSKKLGVVLEDSSGKDAQFGDVTPRKLCGVRLSAPAWTRILVL